MGAAMDEILEHAKRMEQTMDTVRDMITVCPDIHQSMTRHLYLQRMSNAHRRTRVSIFGEAYPSH